MDEKEFIAILQKFPPHSAEVINAINIFLREKNTTKDRNITLDNQKNSNTKSEKERSFILNIDESNIQKLNDILNNLDNGLDINSIEELVNKIKGEIEDKEKESEEIREKEKDEKEKEDRERQEKERDEEERAREEQAELDKKLEEEEKIRRDEEELKKIEEEEIKKKTEEVNEEEEKKEEELDEEKKEEVEEEKKKEEKEEEKLEEDAKDEEDRKKEEKEEEKEKTDSEDEDKPKESEKDEAKMPLQNSDLDEKKLEERSFLDKLKQKRGEIEDTKSFMNQMGLDSSESVRQMKDQMEQVLAEIQGVIASIISAGGDPSGLIDTMNSIKNLISKLQGSIDLLKDIGVSRL